MIRYRTMKFDRISKRWTLTLCLLLISIFPFGALKIFHGKRTETNIHKLPPDKMVVVPAGYFFKGSDDLLCEDDERPLRKVFVNAFYIDQFEVTNDEYKIFISDHTYSIERGNYPVTGILRSEAEAYCESLGKRLPAGDEWEKAARGTDARKYPWGNSLESHRANIRLKSSDSTTLMPVGNFPGGKSPYGCYDMSGNAWEWVSNNYEGRGILGFNSSPVKRGIVRGGAYRYSAFQARTSYQGFEDPDLTCSDIGFRCAEKAEILE